MTVLLVRRDPRAAFELRQELSKEGLDSHFSSTTNEALSMLRQQTFSCVVMDYRLETEPTEFFRRYLQLRYPDIATLCIMNPSPTALEWQLSGLGADFVVPSAFPTRDLALTIRYLLGASFNGGSVECADCEMTKNA